MRTNWKEVGSPWEDNDGLVRTGQMFLVLKGTDLIASGETRRLGNRVAVPEGDELQTFCSSLLGTGHRLAFVGGLTPGFSPLHPGSGHSAGPRLRWICTRDACGPVEKGQRQYR